MPFQNLWLRSQQYYRRRAAELLFRNPLLVRPERPLISFTFDDFPQSALTVGGAILNRFGLAGTYYASLGLAGKLTPTGRMFDVPDLTTLLANGHELGCHTFSHCDSWDTGTSAFEESIVENRRALSRLLPGAEFRSFSYPISLPRPHTKRRTANYFACCRAGGQSANTGIADANQLSAFFLEKSRHNLNAVLDLIDYNRRVRGWLIFATHDISGDPTPFGCTPEFFEQVVQHSVKSGAQIVTVNQALQVLRVPDREGLSVPRKASVAGATIPTKAAEPAKALVSILIPAHNAQEWISETLRSAIAQTWPAKEIIVVDDGSTDRTVEVARSFGAQGVQVICQKNQGAAAARNTALAHSRGEYIQWLDADDLLAPDKIARQMDTARVASKRTLLSSEFGKFMYRWYRAEFVPSALWNDLSPAEWLLRKMGENLYMQTATWLVSRELTDAAGPWDTRLLSDDDGEYFCRVILASDGVRFVPEAKTYYRAPGAAFGGSLSYVGRSDRKIKAHWLSMQLHIGYLRSLEESKRTREACVNYLQRSLIHFYQEDPEIVKLAEETAGELGGKLKVPYLSWKYSWVKLVLGWSLAKRVALFARKIRWSSQKLWDEALFHIEGRGPVGTR
jgi:glycosyltransferase involved in cell wall biosynthesis/peptidoglycan/xylan/chitin deacetylase (PgdA/CDA1 family)